MKIKLLLVLGLFFCNASSNLVAMEYPSEGEEEEEEEEKREIEKYKNISMQSDEMLRDQIFTDEFQQLSIDEKIAGIPNAINNFKQTQQDIQQQLASLLQDPETPEKVIKYFQTLLQLYSRMIRIAENELLLLQLKKKRQEGSKEEE